jgi:Tfp pilus assembly protein FimV
MLSRALAVQVDPAGVTPGVTPAEVQRMTPKGGAEAGEPRGQNFPGMDAPLE